ncbi:MAG: DMT family transporter [Immundisolibacterales bacterium]|nr:DMT family transporter [Immundisolibacterales bacterium]
MRLSRLTGPELAIAVSGALWGIYWIPVRYLEARGFGVVWLTLAVFVVGLVLLAPLLVRWPGGRAAFSPRMLVTGLLTGGAFILYSISIALTEVVSAILLFYLSPVWATVLGRLLLRERLTGARLTALALGIGGLWVVLGGESGVPLPRNAGDWFALTAGVAWAFGTIRVHQDVAVAPLAHVTALFVGGTVATLVVASLPFVSAGPPPAVTAESVVIVVVVAALSVASALGILWAVRLVSPGRAGLLMMMEVVTGLATAAAFAGEPFGAAQIVGSMLIVGAALVEVLPATGRLPARPDG